MGNITIYVDMNTHIEYYKLDEKIKESIQNQLKEIIKRETKKHIQNEQTTI